MFAHIISFLRIQKTSTIMKLSIAILSLFILGNALHCDASSLRALRKLDSPSVDTNSVESMESMESISSDDSSSDSTDSSSSLSSSSSGDFLDGDTQLLASALQSSGALSASRGSFVVAGLGVAAAIWAF
jgi:hypothetical protein